MAIKTFEQAYQYFQELEYRNEVEKNDAEDMSLADRSSDEINRVLLEYKRQQLDEYNERLRLLKEEEKNFVKMTLEEQRITKKFLNNIKKFSEKKAKRIGERNIKLKDMYDRVKLREAKRESKPLIKLFHDFERERKAQIKKEAEEAEDNKSAILEFLKTPIQELIKLPKSIKKDYEDLFKSDKPHVTELVIPGWDDIIKLKTEARVSLPEKRKWKEWRAAAKKAGHENLGFDLLKIAFAANDVGMPPINSDQILSMGKRYARARQLLQSPTPKTVQNIGSILTWFDDINDGFVTLAYLARVGHHLMRKAAPKVASRMIPGIGYILLAKDLFDLAKRFRALNLLHSDGKRKYWQILEALSPMTKKRVSGMRKLKNLLPTFSEAIQIAQTTEITTGYGLSLGPVVGFGLDSYFKAATHSDMPVLGEWTRLPQFPDELSRVPGLTNKSPNLTPTSLDCMRILNTLPNILYFSADLSFEDNLLLLTAANHAAVYLAETGDLRDIDVWAKDNIDTPEAPPTISDDVRYDLEELGIADSGPAGLHPQLGGVAELSPRMKSSLSASVISDSFRPMFIKNKDDPRVGYAATIISELADNLIRAYEGKEVEIETKLGPAAAGFFQMREFQLDKKLGTPEDLEMSLWQNITDRLIRQQKARLPLPEAEAIVNLLKTLKP